jgi:YD repeat-containing protein
MRNNLLTVITIFFLSSCQKNTTTVEPECPTSSKFEFTENGKKSILTYDESDRIVSLNRPDGTTYTYDYKNQDVSVITNSKFKHATFGLSKSNDLESYVPQTGVRKGTYEYDSDNHLAKCQMFESPGITDEFDQFFYTIFDWKDGNMLMSKVYGKSGVSKEQLRRYIKYEYDTSREAQMDDFYSLLFSEDLYDIYNGGTFNNDIISRPIRTGKPIRNLVKRRLSYDADGILYNEDVYEYEIDKYKRITSVKVTSSNVISPNYTPTIRNYTFKYLCD